MLNVNAQRQNLAHTRAQWGAVWQEMQVTRVAAGAEHSMAITAAGAIFAWGWGRYGCIGDGAFQDRCTLRLRPLI